MRGTELPALWGAVVLGAATLCWAAEESAPASATPLSPQAADAVRLLESSDHYQRQVGFLRLEALREPATVETLRAYLRHRDEDVRAWSARALAAVQGVAAIPTLLDLLGQAKSPMVRRAALLGLEPLQEFDPTLVAAFLKALRDPNPEVRMAAVDVVSRIDSGRAKEAILLRRKREPNRDVRRVLTAALKRMGFS